MVPHHTGGKILTVVLVLVGVSFVMYMFSKIVEAMVEGGLREILGKRQMKKQLSKLNGHYIVCGHGRIGSDRMDRYALHLSLDLKAQYSPEIS